MLEPPANLQLPLTTVSLILFWIFAALMLACALGVVFMRNPVNSAMCLVLTFIALAALFVTLDAFFIAVIQVLVYAGAVMVLFLFIIMLLDLKSETARKLNIPAWLGGGVVIAGMVSLLMKVVYSNPAFSAVKPELAGTVDDVRAVGMTLFTEYNLPFQIIGVLLLAATVGVVVLSKKELE
jgi:NADH-quinone oxidoreductase subunit J